MAKWANDNVMDNGLNWIKNNVESMHLCSAQPTTYAEATSTYSLGSVAVTGTDITIADGDTSGRKATVAAKTVTASGAGTITHYALVNDTSSILMYVTTTDSNPVVSGDTINCSAWDIEISDPS